MQNEALLRQRQVRIGGSAYLVMSDAGAGFDGLDDATSQATTTTSAEPHNRASAASGRRRKRHPTGKGRWRGRGASPPALVLDNGG